MKTSRRAVLPSMIGRRRQGSWTWEGGHYYLPHCWGSEALSLRTDLYKGDLAKLSYGSLWEDGRQGPHAGPRSLLPARHRPLVGRTGKLPSNRMLDSYKDEASFKKL